MKESIEVSLKSDVLFHIGSIPVSNSMLAAIAFTIILGISFWTISKKFSLKPTKSQIVFEEIFEKGYDFTKEIIGNEKIAKKTYPVVLTLFFLILTFNLMKFIPGFEALKFGDKNLFRPVHADLNSTLALSVFAWVLIQSLGFYILGFKGYLGKFIQPVKFKGKTIFLNPIALMEIISEIAKMFSLALRLYLNILVGTILIAVISLASHYIAPTFMMFFEIFVAVLQAAIFSLLTIIYIKMAIESH